MRELQNARDREAIYRDHVAQGEEALKAKKRVTVI
jgi:hypothetical protein